MARPDRSRLFESIREALARLGPFFYRYRSYTPLPLIVLLAWKSRPTGLSWMSGLPLALAGEGLRLASLRQIGGASRSTRLGGDGLATGGPYAAVRNPLYLGNLLLSFGLSVISAIPYLPPLLIVLFAVQYVPIVLAEEKELARLFPDRYPEYAARVPRFVPRWKRTGGPTPRHSLRDALRTERRSLLSLLAVLILLILRSARGG